MNDIDTVTSTAERAVYAAGAHLIASRARLTEVLVTGRDPSDVVDEIEAEAEALMRGVIGRVFPDHACFGLAERGTAVLDDGYAWVMSALDGSDNYLRNYPQYAVSIALVSRGEARLSAVYDPVRNEFFGALLGCGAVLNGQPIQCAGAPAEGSRKAATGFHDPASTGLASYMGELGRVTRAFGPVRRSRCRALQLAHLAAGRIDAFWEHEVQPLAAMAGSLLVSESGGAVQARHAGKGEGRGSSVVASRSDLFHAFTGLLMPAT